MQGTTAWKLRSVRITDLEPTAEILEVSDHVHLVEVTKFMGYTVPCW